mmetsp:Transcript_38068/g.94621  ORF Transcript_38068/g.94621 Transcript_38068/m.94621 type:complete len:212 (-) Transcript_38068:1465-2100(-)
MSSADPVLARRSAKWPGQASMAKQSRSNPGNCGDHSMGSTTMAQAWARHVALSRSILISSLRIKRRAATAAAAVFFAGGSGGSRRAPRAESNCESSVEFVIGDGEGWVAPAAAVSERTRDASSLPSSQPAAKVAAGTATVAVVAASPTPLSSFTPTAVVPTFPTAVAAGRLGRDELASVVKRVATMVDELLSTVKREAADWLVRDGLTSVV